MSETNTSLRMLIMAGGTGGHVIPALSLARELRSRGVEVHWLGSPRGIENDLVPRADIPLHRIAISGLRGNGVAGWLSIPWRLSRAVLKARAIIRELKPAVVIGLGGFASGPGGLAAWLTRTPLIIHEQNAIAGMTNKTLARFAERVYAAFPTAFPASSKAQVIGNPVRPEVEALGQHLRTAQEMHGRSLRLLVMGGSLGARALNEGMPQALARLDAQQRPEVRHQAGRNKLEATEAGYREAGVAAACSEFIDDMAAAYAWADIIVCRSGALTVAELAAAGKPSILVPFPFAVDDHQTVNARDLSDHFAARLIPQSDMTPSRLAAVLQEMLDPATLEHMAAAAHQRARPGSMDIMASGCMQSANGERK